MQEKEVNHLNEVLHYLNSLTERMKEDLKLIFDGDFGLYVNSKKEDVKFFEFVLDIDGYHINFHSRDEEHGQIGHKKLLQEYPNGFINDKELGIQLHEYNYDNKEEMSRIDKYSDNLLAEYINWFSICWDETIGSFTKDDYTLVLNFNNATYHLNEKKWIDAA
jgi:hypothetical protein